MISFVEYTATNGSIFSTTWAARVVVDGDAQTWDKERVAAEVEKCPREDQDTCKLLLKILVEWPSSVEADAARWRALVHESARLRIIGNAGFTSDSMGERDDGYRHFGMEAWSVAQPGKTFDNSYAGWILTQYADSIIERKS